MDIIFATARQMPVIIIPDIEINLDNQPILTYIYRIYKFSFSSLIKHLSSETNDLTWATESSNYLGCAIFDEFESDFFYTVKGSVALKPADVEALLNLISHYRSNPEFWPS